MAWLVLFCIVGLVGLVGLLLVLFDASDSDMTNDDTSPKTVGGFMVAGAILGQIFFVLVFSIHVVDSREIGIIKTFGRITSQTDCDEDRNGVLRCGGLTLTAPWQTLDTWNIRENFVFADGVKCSNGTDKCIDAGDNQQQDVFITPKVNIKVSPDNVQRLAAEVGTEYIDKIVRPLMLTTIKATTSEYSSIDIHLKRTEIENKIKDRLQKEYSPYSIEVTRVTFENIAFSAEYNKGIELKAIAIQKALEEENRIAVIQAQAKQAEEEAKGKAAALIAEATGQAEANRLISQSLTPQLIQFQAIQKLQDNISIMVVPDSGTLLQLPQLTR